MTQERNGTGPGSLWSFDVSELSTEALVRFAQAIAAELASRGADAGDFDPTTTLHVDAR